MKRKKENEHAQLHWSKIRDAVLGPSSLLKSDENVWLNSEGYYDEESVEPLVLHHGTELSKSICINYAQNHISIKSVIYSHSQESYILILTNGYLCECKQNGKQEVYQCVQPVLSITSVEKYKSYAVICQDNAIRILNKDFGLVNTIPFSGTCFGIQYNLFTHEILTYGRGSLTIWMFRAAGSLLIPKKIIYEQLSPNDDVSHVFIENTSSNNQRCFVAVKKSILIYTLSEGTCIKKLSTIHDYPITKVLFYEPLKLLVTGGKDGCIKVWDRSWNLNCLFVGHASSITALTVFPYGPYIMSASTDGTVRTWSLDTKDEINCQILNDPIYGLHCQLNVNVFFCFTKTNLVLWTVNHLHSPFIVLGVKSKKIKTTINSKVSPISFAICDDACIRIICPVNGEVVTVFVSPGLTPILDVEYHVLENLLFVLLTDGRIVKASTTTNPCKILQLWNKEQTLAPSTCTSISLYEYVTQKPDAQDVWGSIIEQATVKSQADQCSTLLLGGCHDGSIVVFNWFDEKRRGRIGFNLKAHREEITIMASNNRLNQLATASKDMTLKVWRVFPFADEALAPLVMFLHTGSVSNLIFSQHVLAAVYKDSSKSSHTVSLYNTKHTKEARPIEHDVSEDHTDVITSISSCLKLRLIATSSMDKTVRIWNARNKLIRVLQLNEVAHSVAFCSQRGNLLLGVGTNIYSVHYKKYLPTPYLYQMVAMEFTECQPIPVIPIDEASNLSASEKSRILKAHSSYIKYMCFIDDIPVDEQKKREEEEATKKREFAILEARNRELDLIKNGDLKSQKRQKLTSEQKEEAFQKYLSFFYTRPDIDYPEEDSEDEEDKFVCKLDDPYKPSLPGDGFFSVDAKKSDMEKIKANLRKSREEDLRRRGKLKEKQPVLKEVRSLSIETDTVNEEIPKKVVKHPLSAATTYTERLKAMRKVKSASRPRDDFNFIAEKLPVIEASSACYPNPAETTRRVNKTIVSKIEQSEYHAEPNHESIPVAPDGFIPNSVVVALYKELRREVTREEEKKKWQPKQLTEEQLEELDVFRKNSEHGEEVVESPAELTTLSPITEAAGLQLPEIEQTSSRIVDHLNQEFSNAGSEDTDLETPPLTPPESPVLEIPVEVPIVKKEVIQPRKPIQKLIAKPVIVERPKTPARQPTPQPPSPPPSPLPMFITQFQTSDWFRVCFPEVDSTTFEKPRTRSKFIKSLLKCLVETEDYQLKTKLIPALFVLYNQEKFDEEITQLVRSTILHQLNIPGEASPVSNSPAQLIFIKKCLQLLFEFKDVTHAIIVELMTQFLLGTASFRKEIMTTFEELGLEDSKGYFPTELYTAFDVSQVEVGEQRQELHNLCSEWLDLWTEKFQRHITSLTGKICRASKGKVVRGTAKSENVKSILKREAGRRKKSAKVHKQGKSIAFVSDDFVTEAANHITPIEVINYFCEMKYENHLERARLEALAAQTTQKQVKKKVDEIRNTVLVLPYVEGYVSLARLGETHESKCHPERETSLTHRLALPPIENKNGVHSLLLRLKTLHLNPFPNELDELIYAPAANADLVTLRYAQKYFIPSRSVVAAS